MKTDKTKNPQPWAVERVNKRPDTKDEPTIKKNKLDKNIVNKSPGSSKD
jgi:hypothetical protein